MMKAARSGVTLSMEPISIPEQIIQRDTKAVEKENRPNLFLLFRKKDKRKYKERKKNIVNPPSPRVGGSMERVLI